MERSLCLGSGGGDPVVRPPAGLRVEWCKWRGVSARLALWKRSFTQTQQEAGRKLSLKGSWTGPGLPGSTCLRVL